MANINPDELAQMGGILAQILDQNNETRKVAEKQLNDAKRAEADKYACYMVSIMHPTAGANFSQEVKSLASVILRRNVSVVSVDTGDVTDAANNANLWDRLSDNARTFVKTCILETLTASTAVNKNFNHKFCYLAIEVQGAMYKCENDTIWQDLLNLLFGFVQSEQEDKMDISLQIFNGLFDHILDHLIKYKAELGKILEKALSNSSLDIKLASLQATANLLSIAERKDCKAFLPLLPLMINVVEAALKADDETVLEEALVEFNELAEVEPHFFKPHFKDMYMKLKPIVMYQDFANAQIRHQPLEFLVSLVERMPSIMKKDKELLKDMLELIFQLMIDIDADIEESWLRPPEGFSTEQDEEEDNVNFGKGCVDRLVSSIGDEIMMPLLGTLVTNTVQNDNDWRYKHAGIMAFSQVGEYIDSPEKIAQMIPIVEQHCEHPNPKIRFASLHCLGQVADDLNPEFQQMFHTTVMPALVKCLDDSVPRVASHACAALTNFAEGASSEILLPHQQLLAQKLLILIKNGISICKENAATALASVVEMTKEAFVPYFQETLQMLIQILGEFHQKEYKQFRGQVIEAITIICTAVGNDAFLPVAKDVIQVLLQIQSSQLEEKDAQRIYLLSAWQRICLEMKKDFAPYLPQLLPSIFSMANLKPSMGISGSDAIADLSDVVNELKSTPDGGDEKKLQVNTDETEEKDVAIQMLAVFIDELGGAFSPYVEQASEIILGHTKYFANDSIRSTCADALPGLIKCYKEAMGMCPQLITMAKSYYQNLLQAMKEETDCPCLTTQISALKDILNELGEYSLAQEDVTFLGDTSMKIIEKSLGRIDDLEKMKAEEAEDEDEELDEQDMELIKEEGQAEYDLQLTAAELLGILFKTHKSMVADIVTKLRTEMLVAAFGSNNQKRYKFALFVLDDMVEHLGPTYFSHEDYSMIVQKMCSFVGNKSASLRQAAGYGIGVIAQFGGEAFAPHAQLCLQSLRTAVEFGMSGKVQEKKLKQDQFYHARDNAIASLGKVMKFQQAWIQQQGPQMHQEMNKYWLDNLPITHDAEEAQAQYQYLSEFLTTNPQYVLAGDVQAICGRLARIYGEAFQEKYITEGNKLLMANAVRVLIDQAPEPVQSAFKQECANVLSDAHRAHIENAYKFTT